MKRLVIPSILILIVTVLLLSGISDTGALTGDISVPDSEVANNATEADGPDSSTSATITIRMTTAPLPDE